jgi:hypothetical protein
MRDEKTDGVLEHNAHKAALGGQLVAILSLLALVPVLRRLREKRVEKQKHHRHFPLVGH